MKTKFMWNTIEYSNEVRLEIEENMSNEIEASYTNFELSPQEALVSLHNDPQTNSIIGTVLGDKQCIDMVVTYSMNDSHTTTYTQVRNLT